MGETNKNSFIFNFDMIRFLVQVSVFSILVLGCACFIFIGSTDPFYPKFSSPKQHSLILGTSKAGRGLNPMAMDSILDHSIFNYAFTINKSAYGPTYYNSIVKKLDKTTSNGIFIVTIDPICISSNLLDPNEAEEFKETTSLVSTTRFVNMNPNIWYILNNISTYHIETFMNPPKGIKCHKNGWREFQVEYNQQVMQKLMAQKVAQFDDGKYKFSDVRFMYLKKTVELLNKHGNVFLVRLPTALEITDVENEIVPDFNNKIESLMPYAAGYLDFSEKGNQYQFEDGIHLIVESANKVSEDIASWILEKRI